MIKTWVPEGATIPDWVAPWNDHLAPVNVPTLMVAEGSAEMPHAVQAGGVGRTSRGTHGSECLVAPGMRMETRMFRSPSSCRMASVI